MINANSYTITLSSSATSSGAAGGSSVRYQQAGQDASIINCSTGIVFPPLQGAQIDISATLNFGGTGGTPAITFNSMMLTNINIKGQIVCSTSYTAGVLVKPTKELPQDSEGPVVTSSYIYLPSVVVTSAVPCIDLDATVAPIVQNYFDFMEPNNTPAGGTGVKVQVSSAQASGFNGNIIRVVDAHGGNVGVAIGTSSTGADRITGNTWTINTDPRTGGTGLETYGYNDYINISVTNLEGSPTKGVRILGNSAGNTINILRNNASTPFEGPSNLNNAIINGVDAASAYISGQSNQSIPSGGTWQKINFNAKEFDTQGNYSTSNSSFVVVLAGVYRVNSQISYVDMNDTGIMQIAVYRNSDRIKVHNTNASGLPAGYPSISVSSIIQCNSGDQISIYTKHGSTTSRSVAGEKYLTYFEVQRISC